MANFLENLSEYNAKAAVAISAAVVECNNEKANMMSSLKTTANDESLSEEVRLNALTALINLGNLLDIPLPPYFPSVTTYALTQTYVGVHNDLDGIQGGAPGEYYHLTADEKTAILNKASVGDINWASLGGVYTDNAIFAPQFDAKQNALVAPGAGTYFVKVNGSTVSYDNSTYITSTTLAATPFTGELSGTIGSPTLSNAAVISKVLTGWNGNAGGTITSSDSILTALQKLNANLNGVIASPGGVTSVALSNNATSVFTTTSSPQTGAAALSLGLNTQTANKILASPNGASGQPSFRALVNADLPVSGASAGNYGSSTFIPQITVNAQGVITSITTVAAASGGQVNTVGLSVPSFLSLSDVLGTATDPIITLALADQVANTVFAGPTTGVDDTPYFRALVSDDIPQLPLTKITGLQDAIANKLDNALNDGTIWIGNSANAPEMRSLTQDILITNTGVVTIQPNVVDFGKMQQITGADTGVVPNIPGNLLGRWAAGTGNIQEVVLSGDFILDVGTGVLSLAVPVAPVLNTKGGLITWSQSVGHQVQLPAVFDGNLLITDQSLGEGLKWVTAQGDIEIDSALDGTFNITTNAVTLGKIQQLPAYTVIGNATATNPATPTPLSKTELTTLVNQFTIDTTGGNTALKGVVPGFNINGFPAGKTAADYFLNASGAWSLGGGGGGGTTTNALTINNSGSGDASGITFNGASPVTISYNTIGAPKADGMGATGTWSISISGNSANVTGIVALANGGTNANLTAVAGAVAWSSGSAIGLTAAGSAGQILRSAGTSSPTWSTATYPATTVQGKILVSTFNNVIGEIDAPTTNDTFLKWNAGVFSWAPASGGGGVSSVTLNLGSTGLLTSGATSETITASGSFDITGTLIVGNGGTGQTTFTSNGLLYGNATSPIQVTAAGTTGTVLIGTTSSAPSFSATPSATSMTLGIVSNTPGRLILRNATNTFTQTIQGSNYGSDITYVWPTGTPSANQALLASAPSTGVITLSWGAPASSISIGSAITSATAGSVLFAGTGTPGVLAQDNTNFFWDNTNKRLSLGGSTTPSSRLQLAASAASNGHITFTAGVPLTATTNGMLSYATDTGNSSFYFYKDSGVTKLISKDRNIDFATGTTSGIIVSDSNGTLTKSADLTALGIFSGTADGATLTSGNADLLPTSITGSKTLPANFFGVGKAVELFVSGRITTAAAPGNLVLTLQYGTSGTPINIAALTMALHNGVANVYWEARFRIVCLTTGSGTSATTRVTGIAFMSNGTATVGNSLFSYLTKTSLNGFDSTTTQLLQLNGAITAANSVTVENCFAYYLN